MAINYQPYEKKEGGKFIKFKQEIPNEGDAIRLKCVKGEIIKGYQDKLQLSVDVLWHNPKTGKNEERIFSCDAPSEENEMAGSQIYRGMTDNNIQPGDVFEIINAGRMRNAYKTIIYNVQKDVTRPAPVNEEDVRVEDLPI